MTTATTPTWLRDHLLRTGHIAETGVSRGAKLRRCRRCGVFVLTGLDADMCALEVQADPTPLSPLGEAFAVVEGRRTFALHRAGGRWEIDWRDAGDIASHPAGSARREDVLRQHRCGDQDQPAALTAASTFPETAPTPSDEADPPF